MYSEKYLKPDAIKYPEKAVQRSCGPSYKLNQKRSELEVHLWAS